MEIDDILSELTRLSDGFPRRALEEAIARRDEITPELIRVVDEARQNIEEIEADEEYMLHIYAMFLLAQFREQRAYRPIVELFSLPGAEDACGDFVPQDLGRILASVCGGDTGLIEGLIENPEINEYVRSAGLTAFVTLAAAGIKTREEVLDYFRTLFRGKLEREEGLVWGSLVSSCIDLYPEEVMDDIRQAYVDDLVETDFVRLEDVEGGLAKGKEHVLADLGKPAYHRLVEDIVPEIEWWACFHEAKTPPPAPKPAVAAPKPAASSAAPAPRVAAAPAKSKKIGRNEPCPCGSGKKYKRCCGG